jgi:hypothetical protein
MKLMISTLIPKSLPAQGGKKIENLYPDNMLHSILRLRLSLDGGQSPPLQSRRRCEALLRNARAFYRDRYFQ